jgi:hypothetical protein
VAVLVALEGWLIADKFYRRKPDRPAQYAAALPGGYKLLANKYFVDEFYGATVVKPLLGFSKYFLEWVVDFGILGGAAWLLGGIATLRERSCNAGNRAICAPMRRGWPRARRRCCSSCWFRGQRCWPVFRQFILAWRGIERMNQINQSILTLILLLPLAGAVLVALVPDRFKLPNWIALRPRSSPSASRCTCPRTSTKRSPASSL